MANPAIPRIIRRIPTMLAAFIGARFLTVSCLAKGSDGRELRAV
jgi:hypothetical protein